MKPESHAALKKREALSRLATTRAGWRSAVAARRLQQRVSLVGSGTKWRITNLPSVAQAMAAWG